MRRSDEPIYWGLFGAGGVVTAMLLPVVVHCDKPPPDPMELHAPPPLLNSSWLVVVLKRMPGCPEPTALPKLRYCDVPKMLSVFAPNVPCLN